MVVFLFFLATFDLGLPKDIWKIYGHPCLLCERKPRANLLQCGLLWCETWTRIGQKTSAFWKGLLVFICSLKWFKYDIMYLSRLEQNYTDLVHLPEWTF